MIDRKRFFDATRLSLGRLNQSQVSGFTKILDEWERRRELTDLRWLAYMLATAWHETGSAMQPISELGTEKYLKSKPYWPYIGEGLVQVTWKKNWAKFGATKPGDLLKWPIALAALFDGMLAGRFTGKKLAQYFSAKVNDPVGARRIVNGEDKAAKIAGYHYALLAALTPPAS